MQRRLANAPGFKIRNYDRNQIRRRTKSKNRGKRKKKLNVTECDRSA